jgi:hypothetical protein
VPAPGPPPPRSEPRARPPRVPGPRAPGPRALGPRARRSPGQSARPAPRARPRPAVPRAGPRRAPRPAAPPAARPAAPPRPSWRPGRPPAPRGAPPSRPAAPPTPPRGPRSGRPPPVFDAAHALTATPLLRFPAKAEEIRLGEVQVQVKGIPPGPREGGGRVGLDDDRISRALEQRVRPRDRLAARRQRVPAHLRLALGLETRAEPGPGRPNRHGPVSDRRRPEHGQSSQNAEGLREESARPAMHQSGRALSPFWPSSPTRRPRGSQS